MSNVGKTDLRVREWLSLSEVQGVFGIARSTLYRLRDEGRLAFYKLDSRVKVRRADIEKLIKPSKRGGR